MADAIGHTDKFVLFLRRSSEIAYHQADYAKQYLVLFASTLAK